MEGDSRVGCGLKTMKKMKRKPKIEKKYRGFGILRGLS